MKATAWILLVLSWLAGAVVVLVAALNLLRQAAPNALMAAAVLVVVACVVTPFAGLVVRGGRR